MTRRPASVSDLLAERPLAAAIFDQLRICIEENGPASIKTSKSQIGFSRKRLFASAWIPEQYLGGKSAPLVLTLFFRQHEPSDRWKEVVEAAPGYFTHHLELFAPEEVDDEVRGLIRSAWEEASRSGARRA